MKTDKERASRIAGLDHRDRVSVVARHRGDRGPHARLGRVTAGLNPEPYSSDASSHPKWPASSGWISLLGSRSARYSLFDHGTKSSSRPAGDLDIGKPLLRERLELYAHTNYDSRVVASGGVKRTVVRVAGSGPPKWKSTKFKAKLKDLSRLKESPTRPKVKIRFTAIDVFGQRATDELKVRLCREARHGTCAR